jgi:hypothetical protein
MASAEYTKTIAVYNETAGSSSLPTVCDRSPLSPGEQALFRAPAAATIYGVNLPTKSLYPGNAKYVKVKQPSAGTTITSTTYPGLANAQYVAAAALDATNTLRVVVKINGTIWGRVGSDATPSGDEFKTSESGGVVTVTFGQSVAAGSLIEVFMNAASDIVTIATLADGVTQQKEVKEVMVATAIAVVEAF